MVKTPRNEPTAPNISKILPLYLVMKESSTMGKLNISNKWNLTINGKPTAYYVLVEYEEEVISNWTSLQNPNIYYEQRILPYLNDKPLEKYTLTDIADILIKIQENPTILAERKGKEKQYASTSVSVIRRYIKRIFEVAENNNICQDIFWTQEQDPSEEKQDGKYEKKRLPKSLDVNDEKKICNEVMIDPCQQGETMGLALMYDTALRNSEAAAQVFRNILLINGHHYLASHTSMDPELVIIRMGGKTYNMYRLIPLSEKMIKLLLARKEYLQKKINAGIIVFDSSSDIKSIEDMPIACKGHDYLVHCTSRDLTAEGRRIFHKIKFDKEAFFLAQEEARHVEGYWPDNEIKDGTSYLLRRHMGETLKDLGCTEAQIQFYLGHVIVDENKKRNDFPNPDMLEKLRDIVIRRPVTNSVETQVHRFSGKEKLIVEDATSTTIKLPYNGKKYRITLIPNEPQEPINVVIRPNSRKHNTPDVKVSVTQEKRAVMKAEKDNPVSEVYVYYVYGKLEIQ